MDIASIVKANPNEDAPNLVHPIVSESQSVFILLHVSPRGNRNNLQKTMQQNGLVWRVYETLRFPVSRNDYQCRPHLDPLLFSWRTHRCKIRISLRSKSKNVGLSSSSHHSVVTTAQAADGSIPSGVYGSGIFPYSLFLMILGTGWLIKECVATQRDSHM